MSWCRVNGWALPVAADSGEEAVIEAGARGRSRKGTPWSMKQNDLRRWSGRTAPRDELEAQALVGAILGRGYSFPFDSDFYGGGGLALVAGTGATLHKSVAANSARVYDEASGTLESKYGAGSLTCNPAAVNLFSAATRRGEVAGYNAIGGATISDESTIRHEGTKSTKVVVAAGANSGTTVDFAAISALTTYVGSIYVYATTAISLRLSMEDDDVPAIATKDFTTVAGAWTRVFVTLTTGAIATSMFLTVRRVTAGTTPTFYVDSAQLELGTIPTAWVDGTRAAEELLQYPMPMNGQRGDISVACWVRGPATTNADLLFPWALGTASNPGANALGLFRNGNVTHATVITSDPTDPSSSFARNTPAIFDATWHHVAVTWRKREPSTGQSRLRVYTDGVLRSTDDNQPGPNPHAFTALLAGNGGTGLLWWGLHRLDDLVVVPYAMHGDQVAGLYSAGFPCSPLPRIYVDGDVAPGLPANTVALGSVDRGAYVAAASGGNAFNHRHRTIDLAIDEIEHQATPT